MKSNIRAHLRPVPYFVPLCLIGFVICCPVVRAQEKDFTPVTENAALLAGLLNQYQQQYKDNLSITDMVMMEFNSQYKITNATIYDKTKNTAIATNMADYNSQHMLAVVLKALGAFDYAFTTGEADNSNFAVCYSDWERSSEYHGQTFNAIRYNGKKLTTDKIELKSKASMMHVFPAKGGSIMIMEYFRKDKRLDFRLEKLG